MTSWATLTCAVQVMDLLGPSLWDRWNKEGQRMPENLVACIAVEALTILEHLHSKGCVPLFRGGSVFRLSAFVIRTGVPAILLHVGGPRSARPQVPSKPMRAGL